MTSPPIRSSQTVQAAVLRALPAAPAWAVPGAVSWVEETGSTNADLMAVGQQARAERSPIVARMLRMARRQNAGRGRLARGWTTPADAGLAMSIGMALPLVPTALSGFTLVCGLAVHAALRTAGAAVRLKWPNDVLSDDARAKVGGILVEIVQLDARRTWVVTGIGINLRAADQLSAQWGRAIADVAALGAPQADAVELAAAIVAELEARVAVFVADGFAPFVEDFNAAHAFHGRPVVLTQDGAPASHGVCVGVDARGEVLIRGADGAVAHVLSGEVSMAAMET